ncbi:hypothetical protein D3C86_1088060 [compost metagenome]
MDQVVGVECQHVRSGRMTNADIARSRQTDIRGQPDHLDARVRTAREFVDSEHALCVRRRVVHHEDFDVPVVLPDQVLERRGQIAPEVVVRHHDRDQWRLFTQCPPRPLSLRRGEPRPRTLRMTHRHQLFIAGEVALQHLDQPGGRSVELQAVDPVKPRRAFAERGIRLVQDHAPSLQ